MNSINDSSYSVAGNALLALGSIDSAAALSGARTLASGHPRGALSRAITSTLYTFAGENDFDTLAAEFENALLGMPNSDFFSIFQII